jgi:hypothetical protein
LDVSDHSKRRYRPAGERHASNLVSCACGYQILDPAKVLMMRTGSRFPTILGAHLAVIAFFLSERRRRVRCRWIISRRESVESYGSSRAPRPVEKQTTQNIPCATTYVGPDCDFSSLNSLPDCAMLSRVTKEGRERVVLLPKMT